MLIQIFKIRSTDKSAYEYLFKLVMVVNLQGKGCIFFFCWKMFSRFLFLSEVLKGGQCYCCYSSKIIVIGLSLKIKGILKTYFFYLDYVGRKAHLNVHFSYLSYGKIYYNNLYRVINMQNDVTRGGAKGLGELAIKKKCGHYMVYIFSPYLYMFRLRQPVTAAQIPKPGETYYTFEPAE